MSENEGVTTEQVADAQPQQEAQTDNQERNWEAARESLAQATKERDEYRQRLNMVEQQQAIMQANSYQQAPQATQPEDNPFDGLSEDDVLTGADFKRAVSKVEERANKRVESELGEIKKQLGTMQAKSQYTDYDEVVGYTLKQAQNDPNLAQAIASSSNPQLLAYQLGKATPDYLEKKQSKKQSAEAQRIVENAQKPGSVNQATTGGGALSRSEWIKGCDDREFEAHIAKIKGGF